MYTHTQGGGGQTGSGNIAAPWIRNMSEGGKVEPTLFSEGRRHRRETNRKTQEKREKAKC